MRTREKYRSIGTPLEKRLTSMNLPAMPAAVLAEYMPAAARLTMNAVLRSFSPSLR
jgi:hypothetical protein